MQNHFVNAISECFLVVYTFLNAKMDIWEQWQIWLYSKTPTYHRAGSIAVTPRGPVWGSLWVDCGRAPWFSISQKGFSERWQHAPVVDHALECVWENARTYGRWGSWMAMVLEYSGKQLKCRAIIRYWFRVKGYLTCSGTLWSTSLPSLGFPIDI